MIGDAAAGWQPILASRDVTRRPQQVVVDGIELVVWRAARGRPAVFIDLCPHENFLLSTGHRTLRGRLVCAGHGWQFDADGVCVKAPGKTVEQIRGRHARVVPSHEAEGSLWVLLPADAGRIDT